MDDDTNVNEFLYSMNEIVVYIKKIKTRYFNKNGIKHKYRKRRFNHLSLDSLLLLEMIKDLEESFEFIKLEERKKETIIFATIVGRIIDDIIKKFNEFSTNLNSIIDNIIDRKLTKEKEAESFLKDIKYKDKPKIQKKEKTLNEIIYENLEMKMQIQQINEESYKRIKRTIKEIEKSDISYNNIKKITSGMIQEYYSTIEELSQSSINKIHEQFYQAFNYSIIKRYIEKNPMNNVKRAVSIR